MTFGEVLYDDAYIRPSGSELDELRQSVPTLAAARLQVIGAASVGVSALPSLRWLVLTRRDAEPARSTERYGVYPQLWGALARCDPARGYQLMGAPVELGHDVRIDLERVTTTSATATGRHASLRMTTVHIDGDTETELLVVRVSTLDSGELSTTTTRAGPLAFWRSGEHLHLLDDSGWFPRGEDTVYLRLGKHDGRVELRVVATIGADGSVTADDRARPTWVLGSPEPLRCERFTTIRCVELDLPQFSLVPKITWIAGAWSNAATARRDAAALEITDQRWFDASTAQLGGPGPNGAPALQFAEYRMHPSPPSPP